MCLLTSALVAAFVAALLNASKAWLVLDRNRFAGQRPERAAAVGDGFARVDFGTERPAALNAIFPVRWSHGGST